MVFACLYSYLKVSDIDFEIQAISNAYPFCFRQGFGAGTCLGGICWSEIPEKLSNLVCLYKQLLLSYSDTNKTLQGIIAK